MQTTIIEADKRVNRFPTLFGRNPAMIIPTPEEIAAIGTNVAVVAEKPNHAIKFCDGTGRAWQP